MEKDIDASRLEDVSESKGKKRSVARLMDKKYMWATINRLKKNEIVIPVVDLEIEL